MVNSMRLSDLQNKDVINMLNGEKIGNVIDAEISEDTGNILKLIIYSKRGFLKNIRGSDDFEIKWSEIKKIGEDVILVGKNI